MPLIDDTTILSAGSTTRRSSEDRFAEVVNVKDFGALGNGSHDDAPNIQAAIDWTTGVDRGVIFFPAGDYFITEALTFDLIVSHSITFRGVGRASRIRGNFVGYLIDYPQIENTNTAMDIIEDLSLWNSSAATDSGAIRWNATCGVTIRNCTIKGHNGIFCYNTFGLSIENCVFQGTGAGGTEPNSVAIYTYSGAPCNIYNCDIVGYHDGIRVAAGASIRACRFELNGNGINIGTMHSGAAGGISPATDVSVAGCGFEANDCGIWMRNGYNCNITSCNVHGHSACPYTGYGAGGTGPLPGADTPPEMVSTYGFYCNYGTNNVWLNCKAFDMFNGAAIHIEYPTELGNTWISCEAENAHSSGPTFTGSTATWDILGPNHSGLKFINCSPTVDPVMAFADLPTTAATGRAKGTKYFITNGTGALGAAVSGGGSTFMEVMWNGSEWTRCA